MKTSIIFFKDYCQNNSKISKVIQGKESILCMLKPLQAYTAPKKKNTSSNLIAFCYSNFSHPTLTAFEHNSYPCQILGLKIRNFDRPKDYIWDQLRMQKQQDPKERVEKICLNKVCYKLCQIKALWLIFVTISYSNIAVFKKNYDISPYMCLK